MFKISDRFRSTPVRVIAAVALFGAGCAVGAVATHALQPPEVMAPAKPVPIASLANLTQPWIGERVVAVSGEVADVFGSQFVLKDASGRILVSAGHRVNVQALVSPGQKVSVQGAYSNGVVAARFLTGADGQVTALRGGRGGRGERHGKHGGHERPEGAGNFLPGSAAPAPNAAPSPVAPN